MLWWKFVKFLVLFSKPQVSFSSIFLSLFNVMKDNSCLAQTFYTLFKRSPLKCTILRLLNAQVKICQIPRAKFRNDKSVPLQILYHSSVSWDTTLLYFFSWNFIYFQQKEPIKIQIWWNLMWTVGSMKFCTLMGFFSPNYIKLSLKNYRWHWRVIQSLKKSWLVVLNMT